jgi:hypothetical protein
MAVTWGGARDGLLSLVGDVDIGTSSNVVELLGRHRGGNRPLDSMTMSLASIADMYYNRTRCNRHDAWLQKYALSRESVIPRFVRA